MRQLKISPSITNRDNQSLDKYLNDISKTSLITAEEEVVLARKIREGDQAALDRLTEANLRFVVSVSKQYQNMGLPLSDLIGEGNVGLIKAAKRFDETKGFKFISYAVWWIRQSIISAVAEKSRVVRLPLNQIGMIKRVAKTFAILEQRLGRNPSIEELAEEMDVAAGTIADVMSKSGNSLSMDAPFQDQENTLLDVLSSAEPGTDSILLTESLHDTIRRSLSILPDRERLIIMLFFGINGDKPVSLDEIGQRLGLTRERVRQLKTRALTCLKEHRVNVQLKFHLDGGD